MLQNGSRGRLMVVGGLADKDKSTYAFRINLIVLHQLLCRLETKIAGTAVRVSNATLLNTDILDGFLYFLFGDKVA